jgi:predicted HTH domain antitoxin
MRAYLVCDIRTRQSKVVDLATAAKIAQLEPDELEYVLDEEGVCETDNHTIADIIVMAEFAKEKW